MTDSATRHRQVVVRSALAPLLGEPRISTPLTSQLLAGDVLMVLEDRSPWLRVRGADAYEGWTHIGYVADAIGDESTWRWSLGCKVRDASNDTRALPLGARLSPSSVVIDGDAIDDAERRARFKAHAPSIAASAESLYVGAPYMWGGASNWGCDCSGFVQRIFALHGVSLPRDAWQQALVGHAVNADERAVHASAVHASADHAPADLLFFSDREDHRITHVGIALGDARMVHSALLRGGIAIEDLRADDAYVARLRAQCVGVQRVV